MPPIFQQSFSSQSTTATQNTTAQNATLQAAETPPGLTTQNSGLISEQVPATAPNLRDAYNTGSPSMSQRIIDEGAAAPQFIQQSVGTGPSLQAPTPLSTQEQFSEQAPAPSFSKGAPAPTTQSAVQSEAAPLEPTAPTTNPETSGTHSTPVREPVSPISTPAVSEPTVAEEPVSVNPTTFREVIPADQPQPPREIVPPRDLNPVRGPGAISEVSSPEAPTDIREPAQPENKPWYTKVAGFFGKVFSFVVNLGKQLVKFLKPLASLLMNFIKQKPSPTEVEATPVRTPARTPARPAPLQPSVAPRRPVTSAHPTLTHAPFTTRNPVRTPEA